MHILATYGARMYITMSEVGEEWVLRLRWRAHDFRLEVPLLDEYVETSQEIPHRIAFCLHLCRWLFPVLQTHTPVPYLHFARKSNTANIKEPALSHINQIHIATASCYEIQLHYPSRWNSTPTPTQVPHPRCLTGRTKLSYKINRNGVMKVFDL